MIKKIARGVLLSVLILGISCVATPQVKESIPNYKTIGDAMKTMEGALEKALDDARISSAYVPGFGSVFICETVFKSDLGKLDEKAMQLVKALGPLIEVEEDESICVIIKYGRGFEEEQEYIIVAPKMNISELEKWKILSSEMKVTKQPEEKKREVKEKVSYFSTPENTVKTYYEAVFVKQDETLAKRCWSQKTSLSLIEKVTSIAKVKEQVEKEGLSFEDYPQKLSTVKYKAEYINSETCIVTVTFKEEPGKWEVIKEHNEWKIIMPAGLSKEKEKVWLKPTSGIQPFFDLSTPENTAKSFLEAIVLKDNEKAMECWSEEMPKILVDLTIGIMQKSFEESLQEDPELKPILQNPDLLKFILWKIWSFEKEEIDENTCYAWLVDLNTGERLEDLCFRVVLENNKWKIRTLKDLEDNPIFGIQREK